MSRIRLLTATVVFSGLFGPVFLGGQAPATQSSGEATGRVPVQGQLSGSVPPLPQLQVPVPLPQTPSEETPRERSETPLIGHDIFDVDVSALEPGPVDDTYVLSPGDIVNLRVWGELQKTYPLTVSADQYLEIPDVPGRVYVGDLPLSTVADRLTRQLATAYAAYFSLDNPAASTAFVDVTLGKIRDVRFQVLGEVKTPGSYTLHPSLSNLIYAIASAGGVKDGASLRNIRIRRRGQTINLDFYDFLLRGTLENSAMQIRNGDQIFVSLKRKEVRILGEVRRPGIFGLLPDKDEDLDTLLDFAGGIKPSANTRGLQIRRVQPNTGPTVLTIDLESEIAAKRRVPLMDQDVVTVLKTDTRRRDYVSLQGNGVRVQGEYPFTSGLRVNDLLARAGGLTPDAYLERADLVRTGRDMRRSFLQINLRLAAEGDPNNNIALESLDELVVSSVIDVVGGDGEVTLRGHVKSPGVVPLSRGMRLYDLLFTRAGLQDRDFMLESYLDRADVRRRVAGSTDRELLTFNLGKLLEGDPAQNLELQSGDEVIVYARSEFLGTERFVTLSGFVRTTGPQALLQGMRLLDVLNGPGGFADPDRRRDVYLPRAEIWRKVRVGDTVTRELVRVNLGAAFDGDATQNPVLESGDEVVVYAAADFAERWTVEIDGAVNKPGTYELASNMTLGDLIIQAGGLEQLADRQTADLFRLDLTNTDRITRTVSQVSLSDLSLALRNGDRVLIKRRAGYQPTRVVAVTGQVQYPGRYTLTATAARVADVIRLAGGLLDGAFLDGAALYRSADGDPETSTRIVLDFERALKSPDSPDNMLLEDGDVITIGRQANTVTVVDEVQQPITIAYAGGKGVKYYLQAAGGVTENADPDAVAVIHPNGRYAPKRFLRGLEVLPGSTIVVPPRDGVTSRPAASTPMTSSSQPAASGGTTLTTEAAAGVTPSAPVQVAVVPQGAAMNVGFVDGLTGTCPTLAFDLGMIRVTTTEGTSFIGVSCTDIKVGDVLEVRAVRQSDRVVAAVEIRRR